MNILKVYFYFFVLLLNLSCSKDKQVRQIPIEDFFKNPDKTAFMLSPDGKYISYLKPYNNRLNIFVQTLDGRNVTRLTSGKNQNIAHYFWGNNSELLYLKEQDENDKPLLYAVRKDGSNTRNLLPFKNVKIRIISKGRIPNNEILLAINQRDSTIFDAYRLNISTGKLVLLVKNPGNITQWYADGNGKLRMALASDEVNETLLYRNSENAPFMPFVTNSFKTTISPIGFSDNSSCIYALSNQNRDKKALVEFNWETGKEHRELYSNKNVDVSDAVYSTSKKKMVFATYETWKREREFLDKDVKKIYQGLLKLLPNTEIQLSDSDSAERKFILKTYTDISQESFYLYDLIANKLVKLSTEPPFKESEMCKMKPVVYKTRDGILINGYLTLPQGKNKKNLPVIVIPHSRQAARSSWGYNNEVQFLANRGYAVFQMNFRGSSGYGKSFWIAGFKQWGGKIQDDITDGVKWLISEGIADPARIAIFGTSFGGYSALHGLCFQPELYSCGASFSGLTNLFTYIKSIPPYFKPYQQMFYETVGNPETDADYFREASPVFHTNRIKAPVFIAQGAKDPRVNVNETNQFVKELKKQKVPVMYIVKEKEGHYFRDQENKLELYRQLEKFLQSNLSKK